jgi:hypothetical protein
MINSNEILRRSGHGLQLIIALLHLGQHLLSHVPLRDWLGKCLYSCLGLPHFCPGVGLDDLQQGVRYFLSLSVTPPLSSSDLLPPTTTNLEISEQRYDD